ncbi:hypothetical protein ASPTUDRAFT_422877 [Aspergillus tubingensis CBS 134.48]|uniref:Uncharacterized protein n=1 Tax=Aspergillus tubingensis (strain CBS 134.48) TaxID=767770 RepID=A0A1L9NEZ2_ASPTC|nr:hypothetical protein ASPTUDRAFT_422877 [Aspergillus tubingensis CBS 134.48]
MVVRSGAGLVPLSWCFLRKGDAKSEFAARRIPQLIFHRIYYRIATIARHHVLHPRHRNYFLRMAPSDIALQQETGL